MAKEKVKKIHIIFLVTFLIVISVFAISVLKTNAYNKKIHKRTLTGTSLFKDEETKTGDMSIRVAPRDSTWEKIFDFNNEGLEDPNYQAYTYDFYITNDSGDEVSSYTFKFTFDREVFLLSAWNGSLEFHQNQDSGEYVTTVPDLREFNADAYNLDTVSVDGEVLVRMKAGDYLVYIPSSSESAREIPIEPREGTTPGIILYAPIGEDINNSKLELEYTFHRLLKNDLLFEISLGLFAIWIVAVIIVVITAAQIKKYTERHEHDNEMINESIETFTGFIDAKDPYTNGHSNRVAEYTRLIAEEMGYEGEELDRVYYVALLHDCGKIGVPDNILRKPGRLTDDEFEVIKSHTIRGGEILSRFKSLENVGEGALYHHERYDGKGYPEGRAGEDIPLIARMICVADSFDAMNSNRVYRKKLSKEDIINEIEKNKGTQFDPKIADLFLGLIKKGKIDM